MGGFTQYRPKILPESHDHTVCSIFVQRLIVIETLACWKAYWIVYPQTKMLALAVSLDFAYINEEVNQPPVSQFCSEPLQSCVYVLFGTLG